jgi:hypothetical protein
MDMQAKKKITPIIFYISYKWRERERGEVEDRK